jgi:Bacterial Ig-like domain (group 3)
VRKEALAGKGERSGSRQSASAARGRAPHLASFKGTVFIFPSYVCILINILDDLLIYCYKSEVPFAYRKPTFSRLRAKSIRMAPTQPFPRLTRTFPPDAVLRGLAKVCIALMGLVLLVAHGVRAQGGVPLVTVATDQSSLNLSNQFGVPAGTAINQAGDFAFVGNGETALFFRAAGASSATRLLQVEDEVPGFPGSQILILLPELGINSSRSLLFGVRFIGADGFPHAALLLWDGTSYHTLVSSDGIAPGSDGAAYGIELVPGSIDDSGDIDFSAVPIGTNAAAIYIVPPGGTPVRVVGLSDPPPAACTWCVTPTSGSLGNFFVGTPTGSAVLIGRAFVPRLNNKGQMLLNLWGGLFVGSKDGLSLVPMASTGPCSPQAVTTGTSLSALPITGGFLNDSGVVAFTNPPNSGSAAICEAPAAGGSPTPAITAGDPAPAIIGGAIASPVALGLDNSGDIVFQAPISGSNLTTFALLRYHPSSPTTDVVAYNCEQAPGTSGGFFLLPTSIPWTPSAACSTLASAFEGVAIANDGSVSFNAFLSTGGNGIYRQTGAAAPEFISLVFSGTSTLPFEISVGNGVTLSISSFTVFSTTSQTEILNNGSVFFASYVTSGAADFAVSLGTPGNVKSLMSTADQLPSGAKTILGSTPPEAAGHFVAFTAQPAAGRNNLLESDLTSNTITRVVSDNDPAFAAAGGPPGNTVLAPNYFLNESGQVAFEAVGANTLIPGIGVISFGSGSVNSAWSEFSSTCGAIYLWSPSGGLKKVVAAGDTAPNSSTKFSCVTLNSGPPSPLNASGQVAFTSPSPFGPPLPCLLCLNPVVIGLNGAFLYSPGGTISEIAAANDTLPGQTQATSFVPDLSVPVNSAGQAAFGAELGTTSQGFYLRNGDATQKVIANGDPVPGTSDSFGFPHFLAGLADNGNLAFTAATGTAADGLFLAPAGASIQTLALDGGVAPGTSGGAFSLVQPPPVTPPGTFTVGGNLLKNFAAINAESDVAFAAAVTGGSADSGYFRVLQSGPAAGALQPVVLQGQAVPGGGTFNTIAVPPNRISVLSSLAPNFALGTDGALAFVNLFADTSGTKQGMFVARPDGTLLKVAATGDFLPGGGVLTGVSMSPRLAAGDAGKFAFEAGIFGGTARRAVFVTAIPPGTSSTTVTLNPLQSPAVAQQMVTLSASVSSLVTGNPSGTVTFFANGISLGAGALDAGGGQATVTTSALAAGQNSVVAQYSGDSNYAPGDSPPLAVVVAGFAPTPAQLVVSRGQSLVIPLTLFAAAGSAMNFTLSCMELPANATCAFDTNPVAPAAGGTTVHLTLTTKAAGSQVPPFQPRKNPLVRLSGLGLAALLAAALFATAAFRWNHASRWRIASCACLATLILALAIGGCGAAGYSSNTPSAPGTPAGPATFVVTGTSGATTIVAKVTVTVQ